MELNLDLYPAQEEAILELFDENNVILNTPTGSGKSLVAMALHFKSLAQGRKSVYTSPIKALVNEKFLDLCSRFGADQVGLMTGDATVNRKAPILCCTAEILANTALHEGEMAEVHDIIIDEFHYYSDRDRGGAWQTPLLTLSQSRFLLMSATMGNVEFFVNALTNLTGVTTSLVQSFDRPVPLEFSYEEIPMEQVVENLASNAIKYTPEGGRVSITIDTDPLEKTVVVSITDTGLGIPPDVQERVFEKFFRVTSYERMAKGTGLGLNLCRNIVESVHQGRIGVDSRVGEGSRFWFSVPVGFAGARAA